MTYIFDHPNHTQSAQEDGLPKRQKYHSLDGEKLEEWFVRSKLALDGHIELEKTIPVSHSDQMRVE